MFIYLLEVELLLEDCYSLKDKRRIIRSILDYARNQLKISSCEISNHDTYNLTRLGFVTISNQRNLAKDMLEQWLERIISYYPVQLQHYIIEER
ncbi:DUF503 domain-containing protein [Falseniella ignava]|uniref:DUF503 domain-containing protein n=1 Tax=Falseniella ignava CCUG 37419 TaxID=883112 RepID=K1MM13_9LACT|nr:DUF503 domain-containing protein [Falseniella ignava]EKB57134.1 hypothetical protein HMPREF9707_00643 [Falseniella ignava CCUG 37419]